MIVASPSYLSLLWFPEDQRNTATAIANVANALGRGVGFFLGPAMVSKADDLPKLLLVEIFFALLPLLCVATFYPSLPPTPPSRAANDELQQLSTEESLSISFRNTYSEAIAALRKPAFAVVVAAGGLEMAIYGGWSGVLPSALSPTFTNTQAGVLGSFNTFAGIAGGLFFALLSDHVRLRRHLVSMVVVLGLASSVLFAIVAAFLPPVSWAALAGVSFPALVALCTLAGLLRGGCDPLFFELSAEAAHPATAATAGGVLTLWYHLVLVAMLSVPAGTLQAAVPVAMAGCMLVSSAMMVPVRIRYTRRE